MTMISRRVLAVGGLVGLASVAIVGRPSAQRIGDVPPGEITKPGALPDLIIGSADAKVTIVEYASMTCGHCAEFHTKVFPALKAKYVDTGKVRFIFRELPWDELAAAASMLGRCAGPDKALPMISALFAAQSQWAVEKVALQRMFDVAKGQGFTQDTFDKCLADQALLEKISAGRDRATKVLKVEATPTFFVGTRKIEGVVSLAEFDKVLEPLLKG